MEIHGPTCSESEYKNAIFRQSLCQDGKLKEHTSWHFNGQIQMKESYRNGKREGTCKSWHDNGHPMRKAFYRNGKLEGEYKYWLRDGWLWSIDFYRNGNLILCRGEKCQFDGSTKLALLRISKRFRINAIDSLNNLIISDLVKIVSQI